MTPGRATKGVPARFHNPSQPRRFVSCTGIPFLEHSLELFLGLAKRGMLHFLFHCQPPQVHPQLLCEHASATGHGRQPLGPACHLFTGRSLLWGHACLRTLICRGASLFSGMHAHDRAVPSGAKL